MTITLKLTEQEMRKLIAEQLCLKDDNFELIIEPTRYSNFTEFMKRLESDVVPLIYKPDLKIAAIKQLRELSRIVLKESLTNGSEVMSLIEAKWTVENWSVFYSFLCTQKRFPKFNLGYSYRADSAEILS